MKSNSQFLILCTVIFGLYACKSSSFKKSSKEVVLLAWNEDSTNSYQLMLTKNHKFYYTISLTDSIKRTSYFSGKYLIDSNKIMLLYKNNIQPQNATNYLIKEMQGRYLIQNFTINKKRVFMRIYPRGSRFKS